MAIYVACSVITVVGFYSKEAEIQKKSHPNELQVFHIILILLNKVFREWLKLKRSEVEVDLLL